MIREPMIRIKDISKSFPGVQALKNVSFDIYKNTVHCIVGENGAGKSTLIKILTGVFRQSEGKIFLGGREYNPRSTRDAMDLGMSVLFQELNVVDQLTVEQNLMLGRERNSLGFILKAVDTESIFGILQSLDRSISPKQKVGDLSVAQKQVVEITRAISTKASVIIMDEPTASISEDEVERLFEIIKNLRKQNITVIYISHRLSEIFEIGDYVTVLRDGMMIDTKPIPELSSRAELIKMMIGKELTEVYAPNPVDYSSKVLEVNGLSNKKLKNVSFDLHRGEIIGFYGLVGSGKTEIGKALYGVDSKEGSIQVNGKKIAVQKPIFAIQNGMALVPEERRAEGLFTRLSLRENVSIMNLKKISRFGISSKSRERSLAKTYIRKLRIAARDEEQIVSLLSGGNQQKVVVSKCLNADSHILLLDEPTRGIDVGAKEEIHNIIRDLSRAGNSIIVFSSELPEILNLCDRIFLLFEGEIKAVIKNGSQVDREKIMHIVTSGEEM
jgi:ribose transport system ATP-binding protein